MYYSPVVIDLFGTRVHKSAFLIFLFGNYFVVFLFFIYFLFILSFEIDVIFKDFITFVQLMSEKFAVFIIVMFITIVCSLWFCSYFTKTICKTTHSCHNISIRTGKIVWKVSESSIICSWIWVPEDTSTQAISKCIKCKHWMCRKIKIIVFFVWPAPWSTDISLFYCSDINLFLRRELCNLWLIFFKNSSRSFALQK